MAAAAGIGLSVASVAAWLAWLSGTGMTGAVTLTLLVTAAAAVARVVWRGHATSLARSDRFDFGAGALAAVATGAAAVTGPWLIQTADAFYHLAAARALLTENRALPQGGFFDGAATYPDVTGGSVHLVLAWLSLVGGLFPSWSALMLFGAAFTTVCVAVFAREITRSTPAALIGSAAYLVVGRSLDMRAAGYPNAIAPGIAWLSFTFFLRFVRSKPRSWRELVVACLLAFTAASVYSGTAPLIAVMIAATFATATLAELRARRFRSLVPLAIACAAVGIVTLPLLFVRIVSAVPTPGPEASLAVQASPLHVHALFGYGFIDPRFWFTGLVSVATVGTVCLLGRARRQLLAGDPGAALLWGCSLIVPAIAVTPLLTNWPTGLYFLARIAVLLSTLLFVTLGWELWELRGLPAMIRAQPVGLRPGMKPVAGFLLACACTYAIAAQLPAGVISIYLGSGSNSAAASRLGNLTVHWADRLRALQTAGPGTILADAKISFELAGLTGRRIVAVPFTHRTYQDEAADGALRRGDVVDALDPSADPTTFLSVLVRYRVTFVLIDLTADGQATWDWIAGQEALTTVAEGSGWRLYRFDSARVDQALDIPLKGGVGMFPSRVIAGRAVFVRVTAPGQGQLAQATAVGLNSGAKYQTQFVLPDQAGATVTAPLLLPDLAPVDRYSVTVNEPGTAPVLAGQVEVGHAYEAEYFAGVFFNLVRGYVRQAGWNTLDDPTYKRGEAAASLLAESVASHPLTDPPGDYCLSLLVFDTGDGTLHTLDVGLGGTVVTAAWSGDSKGMRDLEMAARAGSTSGQLTYWLPAGATIRVIVDRITLYPSASSGSCGSTSST